MIVGHKCPTIEACLDPTMKGHRMAKSLLDKIGLERSNKLMREATHQAIADAHAHGLPVTADVGGVLSKIFPDGHVEPVKPAPAIAKKKTLAA